MFLRENEGDLERCEKEKNREQNWERDFEEGGVRYVGRRKGFWKMRLEEKSTERRGEGKMRSLWDLIWVGRRKREC